MRPQPARNWPPLRRAVIDALCLKSLGDSGPLRPRALVALARMAWSYVIVPSTTAVASARN
jgi:hypothetical protein